MIEVYRNGITSRVVDTGYIELDDDQETQFQSDYPILCRKKSDTELVVTNLSDPDQGHVCFNLGHYNFISFLETTEDAIDLKSNT